MNAKALLGLGLAVAAGVAILFGLRASGDEEGHDGQQRVAEPGAVGADDGQPLAGVDRDADPRRPGGAASEVDASGAAWRAALLDLAPPSEAASVSRAIEVRVEWPDEARPNGALRAVALDEDISGVRLLRLLQSDPGLDSPWRVAAEALFAELEEDGAARARSAAIASAAVAPGPDGAWSGVLHVPLTRGRVYVHVVGDASWSVRAEIADVTDERVAVPVERTATLSVEVAGEDAADAIVRIEEPESILDAMAERGDGTPDFEVEARVDAEGRLGPLIVPAGRRLEVSVHHPTAAARPGAPVTLEAGADETVRVELFAGTTLAGRVLDVDGSPAGAGLVVEALRPGRAFGFDDMILRETETDAEGRFALVGLDGTRFVVRADGPAVLAARSEALEVELGGARRDLELTLREGGEVSGRLVDVDGAPLADHVVRASFDIGHMIGPASLSAMSGPTGNSVTDGEGAFRITGLGKGPFSVMALDADGDAVARVDGVGQGEDSLVLVARPPSAIEGVATDETGAPVASLEVQMARLASGSMGDIRVARRRTVTGPDGSFRFDGVLPGSYELWSRTETHASIEGLRVVVDADGPANVTLEAPRAASASGVVLAPDGRPVADAEVTLIAGEAAPWQPAELSGPTVPPTRTNDEGRFALLGLPASSVQIRASKRGFANGQTEPFELRPGESRSRVQIALQTGGTIEGICFDEEGLTAGDRLVTAQSISLGSSFSAPTADDGTFRFEGLDPGAYQLVAFDPDAIRGESGASSSSVASMMKNMRMARAEVVEGETAFVFLGAPAVEAIDVAGRVTRAGEPVEGILISWAPAGAEMQEGLRTTTTDEGGRYELTVESSGDFIVQASRVGSGAAKSENVEGYASIPEGATEFEHDIEIPGGVVRGRVVGPDGAPAPGVRVSLMQHGAVPVASIAGSSYGEITSGAGGSFSFDSIGPGSYVLAAGGAALLGDSQGAPGRVMQGPFTLGLDEVVEDLELRLEEAGRLRVEVVDSAGSPVPEAAVFVRDAEGRLTENFTLASTTIAGVRTIDGLAPGDYTVSARTAKLATGESAPVTVRAGETSDIEVLAEPGVVLMVALRGDDDVDLRAARIQVLDEDGRDVSRCMGMMDIEALYGGEGFSLDQRRFGPLRPGRYRVTARTALGHEASKPVRLEDTSDRERVILRLR